MTDLSKLSDDELRKLEGESIRLYGNAASPGLGGYAKTAAAAVNAVPAQLLGLPVDTLLNVVDLGKAAVGTIGRKFGMKAEDLPQLTDRGGILGSSEYLMNQMRKTPFPVDNPYPEDPLASTLYSATNVAGQTALSAGIPRAIPRGPTPAPNAVNVNQTPYLPSARPFNYPAPGSVAAGEAAGGALSGGLANIIGQATGSPEWAIAASFLPQGAGAVVRAAQAPSVPKTEGRRQAVEFANANDIPLTRGQETGVPLVQRMERMFSTLPGSAPYFNRVRNEQEAKVTKLVNDVTQGGAGKVIQAYGEGKTITLDEPFFDKMRSIEAKYANVPKSDAPGGAFSTVKGFVGDLRPNPQMEGWSESAKTQMVAKGIPEFVAKQEPIYKVGDSMPMTGPSGDFNNYWNLRSLYGKRFAGTEDPVDKSAWKDIRDAFDEAAQRSLLAQGEDPKKLLELRRIYGVEQIANKGVKFDADGNVQSYDPKRIGTAIESKDRSKPGWMNWLGPEQRQLREIGNLGKNIDPVSSSGTAENMLASRLATGMGVGGGGLGLLGAWAGGAEGLAPLLAGIGGTGASLYPVPWAINKLMQSGRQPKLLAPYSEIGQLMKAKAVADDQWM